MKTVAVVGQDARVQAAGRQLAAMGFVLLDVPQLYRADYLLLPMPLEGDKEGLTNLLRAAKPGAVAFAGRVSPAAQAAARAAGRAPQEAVVHSAQPAAAPAAPKGIDVSADDFDDDED